MNKQSLVLVILIIAMLSVFSVSMAFRLGANSVLANRNMPKHSYALRVGPNTLLGNKAVTIDLVNTDSVPQLLVKGDLTGAKDVRCLNDMPAK